MYTHLLTHLAMFSRKKKLPSMFRIFTLSALILMISSSWIHAEVKREDVDFSVKDAGKSVGETLAGANEDGSQPIITNLEPGSWEWTMTVNGGVRDGDYVRTLSYPAKLTYDTQKVEFVFMGAPLRPQVAELVLEHKGMKKGLKAWHKKYSDIELNIGLNENRIYLSAVWNYANGSQNDLFNRLKHIYGACHGILVWGATADREAWEDRQKELDKTVVTSITNYDMMMLFDHDLIAFQEEKDFAKVGYFPYLMNGERHHEVINNGDELIFSQWFYVGDDPALVQEVKSLAEAYVTKKKIKNAEKMHVVVDIESAKVLSVRAVFSLASGGYKGKKLREAYDDFYDGYSKDLYKNLSKLLGKALEQKWDQVKNDKPTYLKKAELGFVLDDDFNGTEGESEDGKEGFFEFTLDEKLNVEVTNTGKELVLGLYWGMPEEVTETQSAKVVDRVNAYLAKKNVKPFPAKASVYPGYGHLVLISLKISLDGTVSNLQLREAYQHMMYEFGDKLDKEVRKAIDKET
ncbi:MAG: hypothetical protein HOE48_05110 [Candidatus Latescibacteria bacterium]|nr:hypothetical protein [Candidatus Latescibacterota bacterium]MBT4137270.1 hypothetical protein [Candidatus Latescibacterota bacterium]